MIEFFLALTGMLLLVMGVAAGISIVFGYFAITVINRTLNKRIRGMGVAFIIGLPIAYIFSMIQEASQIGFIIALVSFAGTGVYLLGKGETKAFSIRKTKAVKKRRGKKDIIDLGEEEEESIPEPEKEPSGAFAIFDKINPLGNQAEKAAKQFVLTRFGEKGSIKRAWENKGKHHVLVQTTSGTYSIILNSDKIVVDWEKT